MHCTTAFKNEQITCCNYYIAGNVLNMNMCKIAQVFPMVNPIYVTSAYIGTQLRTACVMKIVTFKGGHIMW